jgi:hypothetical protein
MVGAADGFSVAEEQLKAVSTQPGYTIAVLKVN